VEEAVEEKEQWEQESLEEQEILSKELVD